ncbi:hypothetical protein M758_3G200900 [Ceratodon purpureus]|nr:hypothetical protein M758_3G200900 [Ceratodon purpureus]
MWNLCGCCDHLIDHLAHIKVCVSLRRTSTVPHNNCQPGAIKRKMLEAFSLRVEMQESARVMIILMVMILSHKPFSQIILDLYLKYMFQSYKLVEDITSHTF